MRQIPTLLMATFIMSAMALPVVSTLAQMTSSSPYTGTAMSPLGTNNTSSLTSNATSNLMTAAPPKILHLSKNQINSMNQMLGYRTVPIGNSSQGTASGLQAAAFKNTIFASWIGNINGTYHVFLSVSRDKGRTYSAPIELTSNVSSTAGNPDPPARPVIANLSNVCYNGTEVSLVWQQFNSTSNRYEVWGSISNDSGMNFRPEDKLAPSSIPPNIIPADRDYHNPTITTNNCEIVTFQGTKSISATNISTLPFAWYW